MSERNVVGAPAATGTTGPRLRWLRVRELGERYGVVAALVLVILYFSLAGSTSQTFATVLNMQNVLGNQSVLALVAIAAMFPLIAGKFDFSVGAILSISSIVTASMFSKHGASVPVAVAAGIVVGAVIGAINGILVAALKVNSLIATIGMSTIIGGIVNWSTGGTSIITGIPTSFTNFGINVTFGVPQTALLVALAALLAYYVIEHTPFGRYLHAIGSNAQAARLVGLRVDRLVFGSFVVSGAAAGLAGVLETARAGGANPVLGTGFTLPALAAAFLGATAIKPGRFNVVGTIVAILLLGALSSGLALSGQADYVNDVVSGLALIVGISLTTILSRRRGGG